MVSDRPRNRIIISRTGLLAGNRERKFIDWPQYLPCWVRVQCNFFFLNCDIVRKSINFARAFSEDGNNRINRNAAGIASLKFIRPSRAHAYRISLDFRRAKYRAECPFRCRFDDRPCLLFVLGIFYFLFFCFFAIRLKHETIREIDEELLQSRPTDIVQLANGSSVFVR